MSYAYAGKTYLAQAAKEQETTTRAAFFAKAAEAYQKEIEIEGPQDVASALAWINLGNAYQGQGKYQDALNAYSQASTLGSGVYYQWRVFAEMAKLSSLLNDPAGIRAYLQKAIEAAPETEKPALQERLNSLGPYPGRRPESQGRINQPINSGMIGIRATCSADFFARKVLKCQGEV